MKIFLLWNIFQKTILNLSKLTSKIVSILYFLWFWPDFFPRFFLNLRKISKKRKNPSKYTIMKLFCRNFDKKKLSQFFDFVDFRHKNGVFSLPQNGRFLKIWKLWARFEDPILIFWKKFWRPKFPFIMCSVDFYHFFLNRNSLKAFYHFILKILKKLIFLKKHAGFARTLKMFFDFNVAHLKMTYRFSGVTNTTYIVIKHFSNTEKTFF